MRQIYEYAKMAFRNIRANKTRSLLTMLGIIIGISSVIIVLCIGSAGKKQFADQLGQFASGTVYMFVGGDGTVVGDYFTEDDIEAIGKLDAVSAVSMAGGASGRVRGTKKEIQTNISSGSKDMFELFPASLQSGRLWDAADQDAARRVITIDSAGAKAIFGTDNVVGLTVQLTVSETTRDFTIVGITKTQSSGYSYNKDVVANITMPQNALVSIKEVYGAPYYQIAFLSANRQDADSATKAVTKLMGQRHGNADREAYYAQDVNQMTAQVNSVTGMFTNIIAAIAGISLLVGGIGVMNIMLVSVTERTREIGIRKALGAKTGSILIQFLIEAGTLTLLGGLIGILLGIAGGTGICALMKMTPSIEPMLVLAIALFSTVIGVFFGIYPAKKAARLSPIEALRTE